MVKERRMIGERRLDRFSNKQRVIAAVESRM